MKLNKTHLLLTAAGVALQMAGSLCMLLAMAGVTKEINTQIKQALIRELSKNIPE